MSELTRTQYLWARDAAVHWRTTLGRITFMANNYIVSSFDEDGEETRQVIRDSDGRPTTTATKHSSGNNDAAGDEDPVPELCAILDHPDFFLRNLSHAPFAAQGPVQAKQLVVPDEPAQLASESRASTRVNALKALQTSSRRRARNEESRIAPDVAQQPPMPRGQPRHLNRREAAAAKRNASACNNLACPPPLTSDDRDRRSMLAASLIAAANDASVSTPVAPPNRAPAATAATHAPTAADNAMMAHRGRKRSLSRDKPAPTPARIQQVERQSTRRQLPPAVPAKSRLSGACMRLMYGAVSGQNGRPPDKPAGGRRR